MHDELTPEQLRTLRRALMFAICLALLDLAICGALLYAGLIEFPWWSR